MPTAAQIRAARGLLGWTQQQLAEASGTVRRTVTTMELGGATSEASVGLVLHALERAGIEFIDDERILGVSVRLRT